MQRGSCVPKHLHRAAQFPITGDKALPLEQREPIAFWLVSADDVNLRTDAVQALAKV